MKRILIVTILLIVPPFIIWGVGNLNRDEGSRTAGKIYGKKIPLAEYLQARDACMLNLYLLYGPNFRDLLPMMDLNRQTWDRLLLLAKASKQGVVISDAEVAGQIQRLFRRDDTYDRARYEAFLQQTGLPAVVFEQRIRDTLAIGRLTRMVTDTVLLTQDELEEAYLAKGEKCKASYVLFRSSDFAPKVVWDESKEREFFGRHAEEFRIPERIKARYILLTADDFKKGVKVSSQEIRDQYDSNRASWTDPKTEVPLPFEKVKEKIRQEIVHQKATDAAFEKATDIAMSLFDQPDLEKAARRVGLKINTTDFFSQNEAKPPLGSFEFVQAAYSTGVGKNSQVVKTAAGFTIVNPTDKKPAGFPSFEQARGAVDQRYRLELARAKMMEDSQKIREELAGALKEHRASWPELLKPLGLKAHPVDPFTRETVLDQIPNPDGFKQACFQTAAGRLTPLLSNADSAVFALVENRQPGTLDNFEKEKEGLSTQLLVRKKDNTLATWYNFLRQEAHLEDRTGGMKGMIGR